MTDLDSRPTFPVRERPPIDPRIRQRRVAVTRQQGRRRLRLLVAAVAVLLAGAVVLAVLHSPLLAARHISVTGDVQTPASQIIRVASLAGHPPLVDISPGGAEARLETLPWVDRAQVSVHWPDSVTVSVTERQPIAALARPTGVALIDATGRVLAWTAAPPPGLLVLTAPVTPGGPGTRLAAPAGPALEVASSLAPVLRGRVRQITVDGGGQLTLDLGGGLLAVLGPAADLPAKYEALASVLAGADPTGPAVIDVRVPAEPTVAPPAAPSPPGTPLPGPASGPGSTTTSVPAR
jgi:cell division protein FtsQ